MIEESPVKRLLRGIQADLADYRSLRDLLETQFEKALEHDTAGLSRLGKEIGSMCERLGARQAERLALLEGPDLGFTSGSSAPERMAQLFDGLPAALRSLSQAAWTELVALVRECKALNTRNCTLIVEQHETMQRVLGAESGVYVPR